MAAWLSVTAVCQCEAAITMLRLDEGARVDGVGRFKELLAVAALPVLTGYAAVATVLATVAALATESAFSVSGVLLAAGPGWLAAYQVPVVIGDHELGLLPLAVTIGVSALVARSAFGAVERLGYQTPRQAGVVIGTVAGTHAVVGVTIAVLANGAFVTVDPIAAFGLPGLVSGVAASVGVARPCGLVDVLCARADAAALAGMRAAALGMAGLLAASALLLTAATAFAVPTMQTLFASHASGFGSGFGMLLLCLGYLPNMVLAVLAFLLGPGFTLGTTSLGPMSFGGGPVPAVPLLAGLPETYAAWWPALLVLPALIGAAVGWTLRASSPSPVERVRSVAVAGAVIGFATVVLTTLAGGALGGGSGGAGASGGVPFPGLLLPAGLLSVAAFAWIVLPGALVAWLTGPRAPGAPDAVSDVQDAVSDIDDDELDVPDDEFEGADSADTDDAPDSDGTEAVVDFEDPADAEDVVDAEGSADAEGTHDATSDADADSSDSTDEENASDAEVAQQDASTDAASTENDCAEDDVCDNDVDATTASTASDDNADPDAIRPDER